MNYRLISLLSLQLARIMGLVKAVEPICLEDRPGSLWVLLILGRGFTCVLEDDLLIGSGLVRPHGWNIPTPRTFSSRDSAERVANYLHLAKFDVDPFVPPSTIRLSR